MEETYRPTIIVFDIAEDGSEMPENFGSFSDFDQVKKFITDSKLTAINQALTVSRYMDAKEKRDIRVQYNDILENVLPRLEKDHSQKSLQLSEAKSAEKDASEMVSAAISETRILAKEVKRGLVSINLDDLYTFRIPYKGRYYFYTWIDGELKLCKISDIPENEKSEIWNSMAVNEEFIENQYGAIEAQEGTEK